jgi:hypothetical protein
MKKLLIVTGPQGSGNHLFSRIFSTAEQVGGWKSLLDHYWIPSDEEPFADYWIHPEQLSLEHFNGPDYWLANVSCPFYYDGVRHIPKILEMARHSLRLGVETTIAIICRDATINREQQLRVRKECTTPIALDYYQYLLSSEFPVHFISTESLFAHRHNYLRYLARILDFPIGVDHPDIFKFLDQDPNSKYVTHVDQYWLDQQVWNGIRPRDQRKTTS